VLLHVPLQAPMLRRQVDSLHATLGEAGTATAGAHADSMRRQYKRNSNSRAASGSPPRQGGGTGGSSATGGRPIQRAALFTSLPALLLVGPCAYRGRPWDPTLETEATGDQADGVWVLLGAISRYYSTGDRLLLNEGLSRRGWVSQNPVTAHGPAPRWLLDQSISRMGDSEYVRGLPSDVLPDNRPPTPPLCTGET